MAEVIVGLGTCGIAAGAEATRAALQTRLDGVGTGIRTGRTGCIGMCYQEPLVEVVGDAGVRRLYGRISPDRVDRLVNEAILGGRPIDEWLVWTSDGGGTEPGFLGRQVRIALRNCGGIDPESIDDAIAAGAYDALKATLTANDPEAVIRTVSDSGLRGRGGAGFPTGRKWRFARDAAGPHKYVVCNADEGDPGAFMDRSVLESDPHAVLEGMAVCGHAIGADTGYIYVRAEYPLAIDRLTIAIRQAEARGLLGTDILGTGFSFTVRLKEGAGAFVCGEETALMASIEGQRGMPRTRPPYPAEKGLWDCPTNINNVETYANIPWILTNGAAAYARLGTKGSKGTKVFAMAGRIVRGGLVEVPMGLSIRDLVFDVCGGIKNGRKLKAVQMGGPSGGCIPAELADTVIDYDSISRTGAIMGSGGLVVMDDSTCMVEVARYFLDFTQRESCGKCTFCRVGSKRMLEILTRICEGKGREGDVDLLLELAHRVRDTSLCGLGQTAPNPVLTTIRYFRSEYEAHIANRKCPAHQCRALLTYSINAACTGCTACVKACRFGAIAGERKRLHVIAPDKCTACGACVATCRFGAIDVD